MAKILVIVDSAVIRDMLTDFVGEIGHEIDTAADGREGLRKARSGQYDLCLCDVHLPGRNGLQLLTELGSDKGDTKFVFTDSLPDEQFRQIRKTTEYTCLRKPFDLEQLRDILEQVLAQSKTI